MRSKAAFLGHPIHPMLVGVPIGLLVGTLIFDILYLADGRDQLWYDIAFWTATLGVVSALVAALPGFVDYAFVAVRSDAAGVATAHMAANLLMVALFAVSVILRLEDGATDGSRLAAAVGLSAAGVALLGVSGWLGGELAYRHRIGVEPEETLGGRAFR